MRRVSLFLAVALAGVLAAVSLGAPAPVAPAQAKAPPKCVKWGKKNGKRVCLKRAKPKPKPPAPPTTTTTPPPAAPDGHYASNTSQSTTLQFDVATGIVRNFALSEADSTCDPGAWLDGTHLTLTGGSAKVDSSGKFATSFALSFTDGGTGSLTINGTISKAGAASGTLSYTESFTSNGTAYSCASGNVTWSGGTGASAATPPTGPMLGHYVGTTSQNSRVQFDLAVQGGYLVAINVAIDEIDESCNPSAHLALPGLYFGPQPFFVNASGHMRYTYTDDSQSFLLEATVDTAGHASGSANHTISIPYQGTTYSCQSGPVSFTAAHA